MAKRISRRELKEKIKNLEFDLMVKESRAKDTEIVLKDLEKRFRDLGRKVEMFHVQGTGIECIEINPEPWGNYFSLFSDFDLQGEMLDGIKERLVIGIARGLIAKNLVQFIFHDDFMGKKTVAAKVWIVPWDQLVKKVIIRTDERGI